MTVISRLFPALPRRSAASAVTGLVSRASAARAFHFSAANQASSNPPGTPAAPGNNGSPEPTEAQLRIERKVKQAKILGRIKDSKNPNSAKKRFWHKTTVIEVDGALQVQFDDLRLLRHPTTKAIVRLPLSKPGLAHGLAMEWDSLTSAQDATKQHKVPLMSLVCRALDIAADDAADTTSMPPIRTEIVTRLLHCLDTDALLCWAPAPPDPKVDENGYLSKLNDAGYSLRELQEESARRTVKYLTSCVWPNLPIVPVLDEYSIIPRKQPEVTRQVIQGWITNLDPWELAALETATYAGKSLLVAAHLIVEWSEGGAGVFMPTPEQYAGPLAPPRFDAEAAARATSIEVTWQTANWGEVEDTHDVDHEDVRRKMGSAVLLVSGTNAPGIWRGEDV